MTGKKNLIHHFSLVLISSVAGNLLFTAKADFTQNRLNWLGVELAVAVLINLFAFYWYSNDGFRKGGSADGDNPGHSGSPAKPSDPDDSNLRHEAKKFGDE